MDEIYNTAITRYFNTLVQFGFKSYADVTKLLFLDCIKELKEAFDYIITDEDNKHIDNAISAILGTSCLLPYPKNCDISKLYL
jgi:hypothetical protein